MCDDSPRTVRPLNPTDQEAQLEIEGSGTTGGRHHSFCILQFGPEDDHGDWCVSEPVGDELPAHTEAGPVQITVDVAASYLRNCDPHITPASADAQRYVRLLVERPAAPQYERHDIYLDLGAAIALAAYQTCAAFPLCQPGLRHSPPDNY